MARSRRDVGPTGRGLVVRGRSGPEQILVRGLRASDGGSLVLIHQRLGPQSRIDRYLAPKPLLSARDIALLTAVDRRNHVGLIAFARSRALPIGVARFVRSEGSEEAEIAIEVIDEWQRRGVGRLLLAELRTRALDAGVRRVMWTAFESNRAIVALSRNLSDCRCTPLGDGVAQWTAALA